MFKSLLSVNVLPGQWNLQKTFQNEFNSPLITKIALIFLLDVFNINYIVIKINSIFVISGVTTVCIGFILKSFYQIPLSW